MMVFAKHIIRLVVLFFVLPFMIVGGFALGLINSMRRNPPNHFNSRRRYSKLRHWCKPHPLKRAAVNPNVRRRKKRN